MFESITPKARIVAGSAQKFARKLGHGYVGREHLLYVFASGDGGDVIRKAFEVCGLSEPSVRAAIDYVDGGKHPHAHMRQRLVSPVLAEHRMDSPNSVTPMARQRFMGFSANAETVLIMAINEAKERGIEPGFEDILHVFLREAERSDDDRRVMMVIHHAAPNLTLSDIRSAVLESFSESIDAQEAVVVGMKGARHAFMYTGAGQA